MRKTILNKNKSERKYTFSKRNFSAALALYGSRLVTPLVGCNMMQGTKSEVVRSINTIEMQTLERRCFANDASNEKSKACLMEVLNICYRISHKALGNSTQTQGIVNNDTKKALTEVTSVLRDTLIELDKKISTSEEDEFQKTLFRSLYNAVSMIDQTVDSKQNKELVSLYNFVSVIERLYTVLRNTNEYNQKDSDIVKGVKSLLNRIEEYPFTSVVCYALVNFE